MSFRVICADCGSAPTKLLDYVIYEPNPICKCGGAVRLYGYDDGSNHYEVACEKCGTPGKLSNIRRTLRRVYCHHPHERPVGMHILLQEVPEPKKPVLIIPKPKKPEPKKPEVPERPVGIHLLLQEASEPKKPEPKKPEPQLPPILNAQERLIKEFNRLCLKAEMAESATEYPILVVSMVGAPVEPKRSEPIEEADAKIPVEDHSEPIGEADVEISEEKHTTMEPRTIGVGDKLPAHSGQMGIISAPRSSESAHADKVHVHYRDTLLEYVIDKLDHQPVVLDALCEPWTILKKHTHHRIWNDHYDSSEIMTEVHEYLVNMGYVAVSLTDQHNIHRYERKP
jgi:hypothetical protein